MMKSKFFWMLIFSCFLSPLWGQVNLVELKQNGESVYLSFSDISKPGIINCSVPNIGSVQCLGVSNCKECEELAMGSNRAYAIQQGKKFLIGDLPKGAKITESMYLIPISMKEKLVKCNCKEKSIYSNFAGDCESACQIAMGGKEPVGYPIDTVYQGANGAGTRDAVPRARGRPGLRHETAPKPDKENTLANAQNSVTTGKVIDTANSITQGKPSLIGLEQEGIHTTTYNAKKSGSGSSNKPKQETTTLGEISALAPLKKTGTPEGEVDTTNQSAQKLVEVKTLGDLVSYRQTNEKDSPDSLTSSKLKVPPSVRGVVIDKKLFVKSNKNEVIIDAKENTLANAQNSVTTGKGIDTGNSVTQGKPSLIGLEQDGIHTTTYNAKKSGSGSSNKPKQETTTLGEISALGSKTGTPEGEVDTIYQGANGAGTRAAVPSARGRPGLRSETAPKPDKENTLANTQIAVTTGKGIDTGNSVTQGKPSLIGLEQDGIHTTIYAAKGKGGGSNKPKQKTTTLGEISALGSTTGTPEGEVDTIYQGANGAGTRAAVPSARGRPGLRSETAPKPAKENTLVNTQNSATTGKGIDTGNSLTQGKPSLIGLEQEGIHTTTYAAKGGGSNKPKQETTTLGEISALGSKTGTPEGEVDTIYQGANGAGTRDAVPRARGRPGLRHETAPKPDKENTLINTQNSVTTGKGIDTGNSITQGKPSLIGLEQEGIHTTTYKAKGSGSNKPKQETTTLGEISAKQSGGGNKPKQETTTLGDISARQSGGGNVPKPKAETKPLGDISAVAELKTTGAGNANEFLGIQATQRSVNVEESYKALISSSGKTSIIPLYQLKAGDPGFYKESFWPKMYLASDTTYIASNNKVSVLTQKSVLYFHVQFLSGNKQAVNEICFPVQIDAISKTQGAAYLLNTMLEIKNMVLQSEELKGKSVETKTYVSEYPKPYSLVMPYLTEEGQLFMVSSESGVALSFLSPKISMVLQKSILNGFKQTYKP